MFVSSLSQNRYIANLANSVPFRYFQSFSREKFLQLWFGVLIFISQFNITKRLLWLIEDGNQYVNGRYVNYLVPTLSILDIGILVWLIGFGIKGFKQLTIIQKGAVCLVWGCLILSLVITQNYDQLAYTLRLGLYFTFAVSLMTIFQTIACKQLIWVAIASILIQAILALGQILNGSSLGLKAIGESVLYAGNGAASLVLPNGSIVLRGYGTFAHPNILAVWIISMALLAAKIAGRRIYLLLGMFSALTLSKIAIVISAFMVIAAGVALTSLSSYGLGAAKTAQVGLFNINHITESSSYRERVELNRRALEIIRNKPITGVGAGNFSKSLANMKPVHGENGLILYQPAHNIPLLLLSEFGIFLGSIFIFLIFYPIGVSIVHIIRTGKSSLTITFAIFSTIVFYLSDHLLLTSTQGMFTFITLNIVITTRPQILSTFNKRNY